MTKDELSDIHRHGGAGQALIMQLGQGRHGTRDCAAWAQIEAPISRPNDQRSVSLLDMSGRKVGRLADPHPARSECFLCEYDC